MTDDEIPAAAASAARPSDPNERLLRRIEDSHRHGADGSTSVDTSDLLDMLEREVMTVNDAPPSDGGDFNLSLQSPESRNNNSDTGKKKPLRRSRAGYSSGDSLNSSFTSRLLGGNTDGDDEWLPRKASAPPQGTDGINSDHASPNDGGGNYSPSNAEIDKSRGQPAASTASPLKKQKARGSGNGNGGLDGSFTNRASDTGGGNSSGGAGGRGGGGMRSRPSFDNPFRSSLPRAGHGISTSIFNSVRTLGKGDSFSDYADVSGSDHSGRHQNFNSKRRGSSGFHSSSSRLEGTGGGAGQAARSVSFSIEEGHQQCDAAFLVNREEDANHTLGSHVGGAGSSLANATKSTHSSDTSHFSLGSLAIMSASTRSSHASRSSRSSHGSATTASTHSSNSTQERRRRRELVPVKGQDRRGRRGGSGTGGSSAGGSTMTSGSSFSGNSGGRFHQHHHRRSRKKVSEASSASGSASSRNLYSRRGNSSSDEEGAYGDLHDRHPTRYPKRSGLYGYIEEGNENDGDDEDEAMDCELSLGCVRGGGNDVDLGDAPSDEDGLFRRVIRVCDGADTGAKKKKNTDVFLEGLIASTTRGRDFLGRHKTTPPNNVGNEGDDNDDEASVGETSFLSDLLATKSATRQRKRFAMRGGLSGSIVSATTDGGGGSNASTLTETTNSSGTRFFSTYRGKRSRDNESIDGDGTLIFAFRRSAVFRWMEHHYEESAMLRRMVRCCDEGGEVLPKTRKEWAVLLMLALMLSPLVHVAMVYLVGGGIERGGSHGKGNRSAQIIAGRFRGKNGVGEMLAGGLMPDVWAGSSHVMLSKSSSLRENFILMPDADWIELQISRLTSYSYVGPSSFFRKGQSKLQRLPLPSLVDRQYNSTSSVVLFSLTAANGNNLPLRGELPTSDISKMNRNANINLWNALLTRLNPRPFDAWPCWSHNSLAQYREDGYALMYPARVGDEAREALTRLAREFGQSFIYEFVVWSPVGQTAGNAGDIRGGATVDVPALPDGRSDVMIRRTISVSAALSSQSGREPAVVMRRVKDLPVEDELTMREWEGPPLVEVVWKK